MNYELKYPCGKLFTATGQEYFLLSPHPLPKDSWQHDQQQMWNVVPAESQADTVDDRIQYVYSYARQVVCSNPTVEFLTFDNPIYVRVKELQEEFEPVVPAPENVWPAEYTEKPNKDVVVEECPF